MTKHRDANWVPESCSLPTVDQPLRVAEFDRLFAESVLRSTRLDPTTLDLVLRANAETTARDLADREAACCSFFGFEFAPAGTNVLMRITVPQLQTDVLDALASRASTGGAG